MNDPAIKDYRGSAIARTSDLDGDGLPDMVLGAYADDTVAPDAGRSVYDAGLAACAAEVRGF